MIASGIKLIRKDTFFRDLTGWTQEITPNAVEVFFSLLRGKPEPQAVELHSIRSFGYRLELRTP